MRRGMPWLVLLVLVSVARATTPPPQQGSEDYFSSHGEEAPAPYYFYDYVNKPFPHYPEPIWRQMFPSLYERIEAERRAFGVPGQSARELEYHIRAWRQQRARTVRTTGGLSK